MSTPVIFKRELDGKGIYAAFPLIPGTDNPQTMTVYAHIGQHSSADQQYVRDCKPAKPDEYASLMRELQTIGYDDLVVRKRLQRSDYYARRTEIEGAV